MNHPPTRPTSGPSRPTAKFLLLALLVASVSSMQAVGASASVRRSSAHQILFREDFQGTKLDLSRWNNGWFGDNLHPTKGVNGSENDCYDPKQVAVRNGALVLSAVKRPCLGKDWASGLVDTRGRFSYSVGTLKAAVCLDGWSPSHDVTRTPEFVSDWPGVWTDGTSWPGDGEIDVMEGLNGTGMWHVHSDRPTVGGGSLGPGCHVVKMKRTRTHVEVWYDGVDQGGTNVDFVAQHYVVLNLAVSGSISPPERPATFRIKWIEVVK